ncbi:hypothetical protein SAMN05216577_12816 [Pseudomonas citronellolis]|uniref:Uncharacterized protein n=1 Tax=Pseudomonas citronellolis TaxID=53408 RepID=A0AAQ1QYV9_9PSED|nr:hypothetical protein [Pseudomonas citronellolis]TGC32409.1 hypothetical protein CW310_01940 [Pseudomonas citronellolis]SFD51928.1 hypothetical protein SAMN05216577_12816 [Pseudomonas citronellolis]
MQLPIWINDPTLSDEEKRQRLLGFRVRMAALYHNPKGAVNELSMAVGLHAKQLYIEIERGQMSRRTELAIRGLVGPEAFPEEQALLSNQ